MNKYFFIFIYMFFLVGCSETFVGYSDVLNQYNTIYNTKSCDDTFIDEKSNSNLDLLMWYELNGSMKRNCLDYNASNYYFDKAEELYKSDVDLENSALKLAKTIGTTFLNDNMDSYRGNIYESIMVNVYKGLNFMSIDKFGDARVEFNRALDRQRRAKDEFSKEIEEEIAKLEKEDSNATKIATNKETQNVVYDAYNKSIFADFVTYPDFINPFATYMAGLFFIADKDYKKANEMFKESLAMQPQNIFLKSEFKLSQELLVGKNHKKYIWLIYENGKSATKDEFRLDIPLFIVTDKVPYVGIALPTIKDGINSYEYLTIDGETSSEISNIDRVIKTEFKTKLPFIVTKSLIRTTIKTLAAYASMDQNTYAGIGVGIFNLITNKADVRSWVSLPKNFQAARVINLGKSVDIKNSQGGIIESLSIPDDKNAIIYVNSPIQGSFSIHKIIF
ncbi:MAG: hypothetical protein SPI03_01135 [Campylobacter sputorum]|uniref:COG3014 family protein n=1 Tax=Campylobacter sputorum TaxID=206 RepID=UPI000B7737E2|nr:hypothetical protein [Campylobacter sputorum]ASM37768.1 putative lipoprotein [Campylobacter sputorum bv. paraureolyticus LMG 11764]MDY6119934.1 hypothetical protein [Campylobacter sputorum]